MYCAVRLAAGFRGSGGPPIQAERGGRGSARYLERILALHAVGIFGNSMPVDCIASRQPAGRSLFVVILLVVLFLNVF
jgi:hypothetical protein